MKYFCGVCYTGCIYCPRCVIFNSWVDFNDISKDEGDEDRRNQVWQDGGHVDGVGGGLVRGVVELSWVYMVLPDLLTHIK